MSGYVIGFLVSAVTCIFLLMLFRYEEKRHMRFLGYARARLDYAVIRTTSRIHYFFDVVGRDSIRQIFHYLLHSFLKLVLLLTRQWDKAVRNMIRANKTIAQNAERDRTTRNTLEELAIHKIQNALTEEQKKKHKHKMLEG